MQALAGILEPVFAIRTEDDLGIGDTEGVAQMIEWCHRHGLRVFQTLPINETSGDNSPYNAISALAIDPITLAISPSHVPDLTDAEFNKLARPGLLAELRRGPVNYPKVKALKQALLEAAFAQFARQHLHQLTERGQKFDAFTREHAGWLSDYALFRALLEENGGDAAWERWPPEHQSPPSARAWALALPAALRDAFQHRETFFSYVQWLAFGQWQALKAHAAARHVQLMGDMPIGIGRGSADVWANRAIFDLDWSVGAPPEGAFQTNLFTAKWGQNWGMPLYRWDELRRRDFDWWRTRINLARKVFHLCRLDHVMGFFRIYAFPWPPEHNAEFLPLTHAEAAAKTGGRLPGFQPFPDDTPAHVAANQRRGEEHLRVVLEAVGDLRIVAEDLGFVPDYVRPTLEKLAIPGFRVPALFREEDGRYAEPREYPRLSVAQPYTHDHAPLAAVWAGHWQKIDRHEHAAENRRELRRMMDFAGLAGEPGREFGEALHEACLRAVLRANSWLAVVMITDVFGKTARFNTPGTNSPENWSARLEETVRELDNDPERVAQTRMFSRLARETGRNAA